MSDNDQRDLFAAAALHALISGKGYGSGQMEAVAKKAYQIADAMMGERMDTRRSDQDE